MCYAFIWLAAQAGLLQHHHKYMSNILCCHVTMATESLGNGSFQLHYNLMGPPLRMWLAADQNILWNLTVRTFRYFSDIKTHISLNHWAQGSVHEKYMKIYFNCLTEIPTFFCTESFLLKDKAQYLLSPDGNGIYYHILLLMFLFFCVWNLCTWNI